MRHAWTIRHRTRVVAVLADSQINRVTQSGWVGRSSNNSTPDPPSIGGHVPTVRLRSAARGLGFPDTTHHGRYAIGLWQTKAMRHTRAVGNRARMIAVFVNNQIDGVAYAG